MNTTASNNETLSQKSRISNESQYVDLSEIGQTRRIFLQGANTREFSVILQNRMKKGLKYQMLSSSSSSANPNPNKAVISFKSVVLTSTLQKILHDSGLDLIVLASKSTSKKLSDQFLSSFQPAFCESSASSLSEKSSNNQFDSSIAMYNEHVVQDIVLKVIKMNQQQQINGHECNSKDCCHTLLEMAKNQNKKQIVSHLCRVIMRNGWCVHALMSYIDQEVLDRKLNEQVFQIMAEKTNEIKNASELGGNTDVCKVCQEKKQEFLQTNLMLQKNVLLCNNKTNCQQNEFIMNSQQDGYSFSFIRQSSSPQTREQQQQQQQQQQLLQSSLNYEDQQKYLEQLQKKSQQKHVHRHEAARSQSQSPNNRGRANTIATINNCQQQTTPNERNQNKQWH